MANALTKKLYRENIATRWFSIASQLFQETKVFIVTDQDIWNHVKTASNKVVSTYFISRQQLNQT